MLKNLKFITFCFLVLCFGFAIFVVFSTPFCDINHLASTINASFDMIENINKEKTFGKFVFAKYDDNIKTSTNSKLCVQLKLFNLITIKSFNVNIEDIELYVGGDIVGFTLNGDGVVVMGNGFVETKDGKVNTIEFSDIKSGDILKEIQNEKVDSISDICRIVNKEENRDKLLDINLERNDKVIKTKILNAFDVNSNLYKIGLWVKDDVSGIGTLTYIKKDDERFGALGHAICDGDNKTIYNINSGDMYPCSIIGIKKGAKGSAGELKGLFMQGKNNKIGYVDKNCDSGVFGKINNESKILKEKETMLAGGRLFAKPGKAYIRTAIDGEPLKDYEIEIIKTNYQSSSNEKSMVLRVTSKELLQKTGGIIQGMSGSPIIQNNRVIGAVTHVFLNDSTKGFGIYLDWMINNW